MHAVRWLRGVCSAAALLAAPQAHAEKLAPSVDFRADRLELDPSLGKLRLSGHVVVWVDRYHLSSAELELWTDQRAVHVRGPAELAFCACPAPPLTLRFVSARIEPSEVVLEQPTVRAFGVPVFWLPWLWLRAPSRWGLLPLEVAYRGDDGLLLGSGVHVPVGEGGLDVSGAGYVRGGAEVTARLTTEHTSSLVRWDHLRDTALTVDLRGSMSPGARASMAWSADALRGARALRGPSLLEEVALRQDRARAAAGFSDGGATVGVAVEADAPRGATLDSGGAVGPALYVGFGAPLGASTTANADLGVATWARPDASSLTLLSERAQVLTGLRAGPFAMNVDGRLRGVATVDDSGAGYSAAAALAAEVSAPFVKALGTPSLPMEHWVTPFASALAGGSETRSPSAVPLVAPDGAFLLAAGGIRSTLGETAGSRAAVSASFRAGYASDASARGVPLAAWRATGQGSAFALRGEGVSAWGAADRGTVVLTTLRAGRESSFFLEGRAAGSSGNVPLLARVLSAGFDAPWVPWLADAGWSLGGRLGVPWTRFLASTADADYDVTHRTLLGVRGGMTYRHPCGCLSATAWAGHRTARQGVDGFVTLSLAP